MAPRAYVRSYLTTSDVIVDWVRARRLPWGDPSATFGAEAPL